MSYSTKTSGNGPKNLATNFKSASFAPLQGAKQSKGIFWMATTQGLYPISRAELPRLKNKMTFLSTLEKLMDKTVMVQVDFDLLTLMLSSFACSRVKVITIPWDNIWDIEAAPSMAGGANHVQYFKAVLSVIQVY